MNKKETCKTWSLTIILIALALTACTKSDSDKPVIKLAANPWVASKVNVAVAKIILEEELDYPVEIVPIETPLQWQALADGELHASLELWPSGHRDNMQK